MIMPMRTIIEIPKGTLETLKEICREEKISRAEAIRRAITLYLRGRAPKKAANVFGLWRGRAEEGLAYEDRLRAEWEGRAGGH